MRRAVVKPTRATLGRPTLQWLPHPLWGWWRDLTWGAEVRADYLARMQRYYDKGGFARSEATTRVMRVAGLADGDVSDWDDNIPSEWAMVLVKRWGLR